jgi:AcrR family transcriptional regulator
MEIEPPRSVRDAKRTREAILAAAQDAFASRGYDATGVRDITAAAGINPSLVNRYFGSKEKLFEAALSDMLDSSLITTAPREHFGDAIVAMLTATPRVRRNPLPMMLLASANPGARIITAKLLEQLVLEPLARWFGVKDGESRAARFVLLASGLTLYTNLYPLAALSSALDEPTRRWLAKVFQSLAD